VENGETGSLDGIATPGGCSGPPLVVWRERMNAADRTRFVLVGAVIMALIVLAFSPLHPGLQQLQTSTVVFYVAMAATGALLGAAFGFSGARIYAAGESWLLTSDDLWPVNRSRGKRRVVLRAHDLRFILLTRSSVELASVTGARASVSLGSLQACPPLAALVERQLIRKGGLKVPAGLADALHGRSGSWGPWGPGGASCARNRSRRRAGRFLFAGVRFLAGRASALSAR
jgi:hypothetical protein